MYIQQNNEHKSYYIEHILDISYLLFLVFLVSFCAFANRLPYVRIFTERQESICIIFLFIELPPYRHTVAVHDTRM